MATQSRKCILCIGSDLVNLNLRCSRLQKHGWNVLSSGSGHDGLFRFVREKIDAVVLDLNDDGAENALIAAQVKARRPQVVIVMLVQDPSGVAPGAVVQADAIVIKSQENRQLVKSLKKLLTREQPE